MSRYKTYVEQSGSITPGHGVVWTTDGVIQDGGISSPSSGETASSWIYVKNPPFNAAGDGVTDDTAAVQGALNAASSAGGGTVDIGALRCVINSNINIPSNVTLRGGFARGFILGMNYYLLPSQLILGGGVTVSMVSRTAIIGLVITRGGLSMPATDHASAMTLIGQFNGTGITAAGSDIVMRDLMMLGHNQGISASWSDPTIQQGGRYFIERVLGDCTNGIQLTRSYDISRIMECHFWPFLTAGISGADANSNSRSGIAFDMQNCDWNRVISCFAYGYMTSYHSLSVSSLVFTTCDSDGPGPPNVYGWNLEGIGDPVLLHGCTANSHPTILNVNISQPTNPIAVPTTVRTVGCRFAAQATCVNVAQGVYVSIGDTFESGNGIVAASGTSGKIIGTHFRFIGAPYTFADLPTQAKWDILSPSFTGTTPTPSVLNQLSQNITVPTVTATELITTQGLESDGPIATLSATTESPSYRFVITGNGTDANIWDAFVNLSTFAFRAVNDAYTLTTNWLTATRSGYVVTNITLNASTISMPGLASSTSYANDAAAGAAGVQIGGLYRNGSVVQVRVT